MLPYRNGLSTKERSLSLSVSSAPFSQWNMWEKYVKKEVFLLFSLLRPATEPPSTELFHLETLTKTATHNLAHCGKKRRLLEKDGGGDFKKSGGKNAGKYFAHHVPIPRELGKLCEQWLIYQLCFNTLCCSQPPCCLTSCFMLELVGKIGDGGLKWRKIYTEDIVPSWKRGISFYKGKTMRS